MLSSRRFLAVSGVSGTKKRSTKIKVPAKKKNGGNEWAGPPTSTNSSLIQNYQCAKFHLTDDFTTPFFQFLLLFHTFTLSHCPHQIVDYPSSITLSHSLCAHFFLFFRLSYSFFLCVFIIQLRQIFFSLWPVIVLLFTCNKNTFHTDKLLSLGQNHSHPSHHVELIVNQS